MSDSILTSTKKILGLDESYIAFDPDIIMFINSAFNTISQLGIGPAVGFMIEDDTTEWTDFLGTDLNLNSVKNLVYLTVRLAFDPPATSFGIAAMKEQISELQWRLNTKREGDSWVPPVETPAPLCEEPVW